jgi:ComF family protein
MEGIFAVMFPSNCRICDEPLTRISRLPVCQDCLDGMRPMRGRLCSVCGERMLASSFLVSLVPSGAEVSESAAEDEPSPCPLCRRVAPPFAKAVAYGSYQGGLREMIHLLKYAAVFPAAKVLGRMVADAMGGLDPIFGDGTILVLPVPLHKSKRRQRGFNQAELIAKAALKFYPEGRFRLASGILLRQRDTESQIGMTSHQRRENLRGAFAVARAEEVRDRVRDNGVLLVDDVLTTGATAAECARVLLKAGASKVWVATAARTLKLASNEEAKFQGFKVSEFQGSNQTQSGGVIAS